MGNWPTYLSQPSTITVCPVSDWSRDGYEAQSDQWNTILGAHEELLPPSHLFLWAEWEQLDTITWRLGMKLTLLSATWERRDGWDDATQPFWLLCCEVMALLCVPPIASSFPGPEPSSEAHLTALRATQAERHPAWIRHFTARAFMCSWLFEILPLLTSLPECADRPLSQAKQVPNAVPAEYSPVSAAGETKLFSSPQRGPASPYMTKKQVLGDLVES